MTSRKLIPYLLMILLLAVCSAAPPAVADTSHARIIRLNLVQGDVRFARETKGDPLADSSATWETAELNLPIRQGYVLSTDNGRAAVEFENGTMAFLKEHTVLEFYDLSIHDDSRTTRLVLRQGTASFSVNPSGSEYFSVTGGDFTVEADSRSTFRIDNYDDGSTVENFKGHVSILRNKNSTRLDKGHSFTVKAGDNSAPVLASLEPEDDFDRWVTGRVDSLSNATAAAVQYTASPYYAPGFADLYTYGAFNNCGGYGYAWRPFGAGLGWSPFTNGQWFLDPTFGWTWMSYQPWGWAPFHYGGWLFDGSCGGWFYSPPGQYGYTGYPGGPVKRPPKGIHPPHPIYHPVTAVFVHQGGKNGLVPMHPLDEKGKTPLNLEHGVLTNVGTKGVGSQLIPVARGEKWEALKSSPREAPSGALAAAAPPSRVSRTVLDGRSGVHIASLGKDSSIAYDPGEHRFVNTNSSGASSLANGKNAHAENGHIAATGSTQAGGTPPHTPSAPPSTRSASSAPPSRNSAPPPARYSGGSSSGRSSWGGSSASSGSSGRSSSSSSSSSAGSSSHPSSSSSSGGGKPH
jgi:hypothetical protein